jgi:hypothetical protein
MCNGEKYIFAETFFQSFMPALPARHPAKPPKPGEKPLIRRYGKNQSDNALSKLPVRCRATMAAGPANNKRCIEWMTTSVRRPPLLPHFRIPFLPPTHRAALAADG